MRNRSRGATLIEMLVAGVVATVIGAGVWQLVRATYASQSNILNQNNADANARLSVDIVTDKLRGASAVTAAAASDISYSDPSGNTYRYWRSGNNLLKTVNGSPNGGTVAISNVQSFTCTYWYWSSSAWQSSSAPDSSNFSKIGAVDVTLTVDCNGSTRQMSGSVQIRMKRLTN